MDDAAARRAPSRWLLELAIIAICLVTIFPFIWMISTVFKESSEVFTKDIRFIPHHPTLHNIPDAFALFPVKSWIWNSFGIAALMTLGKLAISLPAAFAFARLNFRGRGVLFALVLATLIVPSIVTVVPNYIFVSNRGWMNSWTGVIVPSLPFTAFYVFLLRQNIMLLPQDLIDAARIDGASTVKILWQIVLPNIKPALAVVTILSFLGAWNQYLWPLLILNDFDAKTLSTGMQFFTNNVESAQMWGPMMVTAAVAIIPPFIVYLVAQKQIIETFVNSGLKG
jgi:ABC-type glycerol-3-phosphate transport system permease component